MAKPAAGGKTGVVSLFIRHTSASLTVQENADPDVLADLLTSLRRRASHDRRSGRHAGAH